MRKVAYNANDIIDFEEYMMDDADIVIFAYGSTARGARVAVDKARVEGIKVGMVRFKIIWPLPEKEVLKICSKAKAVIIPEMNMGQLKLVVEKFAADRTEVIGINHVGGVPISPDRIYNVIKGIK